MSHSLKKDTFKYIWLDTSRPFPHSTKPLWYTDIDSSSSPVSSFLPIFISFILKSLYNYFTPCFHFFSPNPVICTPPCFLSNSWPPSSLIVWVFIYIYVVNTISSVCIMLHILWIFKGDHWYLIDNWYVLPCVRLFLAYEPFFGILQCTSHYISLQWMLMLLFLLYWYISLSDNNNNNLFYTIFVLFDLYKN